MPNIGRSIRRTIRPLWIAGLGAAAWSNREKVQQAIGQALGQKPVDKKPGAGPADGELVTVRTTIKTWTRPLRRREGATARTAGDAFTPASDLAATFVEPTVEVPSTLSDSSTGTREV